MPTAPNKPRRVDKGQPKEELRGSSREARNAAKGAPVRLAGAVALALCLLVPGPAGAQQQTTAPQQRTDQDPATAPTRTTPQRSSTEDRIRREIFREVLKAIPRRRDRAPTAEPAVPAPSPTAPVPGAAPLSPSTTGSFTPALEYEVARPRITSPPPPPRRAPGSSGSPIPAPRSEPRAKADPSPAPTAAAPPPPAEIPVRPPAALPPEPAAATLVPAAATPAAKAPTARPSPPPSQIAASPSFAGFARQIAWPLLALLAAIVAAAAGWQWRKRRILAHTRGALALSPSLDLSQGSGSLGGLGLSAPPFTMRARLEMGAIADG